MCYNHRMVITGVLYDLSVGIVGAVIGAFVIALINRNKTRRMATQIILSRRDVDKLKLENDKLLEQIKDRESQILKLQKQILKKRGGN